MSDDEEEIRMDAGEATVLGREIAGVLIPFQSLRYTSKFKDMDRHAEQEHNDIWDLHEDWFEQARYSYSLRDDDFRSYDGKFWLNKNCSAAIEGHPGNNETFSWVAMVSLVPRGMPTIIDLKPENGTPTVS